MKIRKGFVSNSSSSSFVCDICGRTEAGWDMSIDDAGMVECVHEHVFCEDHIVDKEKFEEYKDSKVYDYGYDIPEEFCDICSFTKVRRDDMFKVLMKMQGFDNLKEVEQMNLDKFDSIKELQEFIKK